MKVRRDQKLSDDEARKVVGDMWRLAGEAREYWGESYERVAADTQAMIAELAEKHKITPLNAALGWALASQDRPECVALVMSAYLDSTREAVQ